MQEEAKTVTFLVRQVGFFICGRTPKKLRYLKRETTRSCRDSCLDRKRKSFLLQLLFRERDTKNQFLEGKDLASWQAILTHQIEAVHGSCFREGQVISSKGRCPRLLSKAVGAGRNADLQSWEREILCLREYNPRCLRNQEEPNLWLDRPRDVHSRGETKSLLLEGPY